MLDRCGARVDCGLCPEGQTCGAAGPNVCGVGSCAPTTCLARGKNCGDLSDECASVIDCGACSAPATCGGSGVANVCGDGVCVPTTCAAAGKNCGGMTDGCYASLDCGTCQAPQTCGGANVPNVCGASCASGCPATYTCDPFGVCVGGTLGNLRIDLVEHWVSGTVTLNGARPSSTCTSQARAYVYFRDEAGRNRARLKVPCDGATSPFVFAGWVPPGTYTVVVAGAVSELGNGRYRVIERLEVAGDVSGLVLDVKAFSISGEVTLNGATPTSICTGGSRARVLFEDSLAGNDNSTLVPCDGGVGPMTYTVLLPAGSYAATVNPSEVDLPEGAYPFPAPVLVGSNVTNLRLNVPSWNVSGSVRVDGVLPTTTCSGADSPVFLEFDEPTLGYSVGFPTPRCTGSPVAWTFTEKVFPGVYDVFVTGRTNTEGVPRTRSRVAGRIFVGSNVTGADFDLRTFLVSGSVTRNGAQSLEPCSATPFAQLNFRLEAGQPTTGESYVNLACDGGVPQASFAVRLAPGTYEVRFEGFDLSVPQERFVARQSLVVQADVPQLDLALPFYTVSGEVTLNGAGVSANCTSGDLATVRFDDNQTKQRGMAHVPCPDAGAPAAFSGKLYPGRYVARVAPVGGTSNLPSATLGAEGWVDVQADVSNVHLDVRPFAFSGSLTVNGQTAPYDGGYPFLGFVVFDNLDGGIDYAAAVPQGMTPGPASFAGFVTPGIYRVYFGPFFELGIGAVWSREVPVVEQIRVP